MPDLTPVTSSNIAAIGYDPEAREMHVQFKSGGIWIYADVPPEAHEEFASAESVGKHFHAHVRSKFESRKFEPEVVEE